MKKQKLKLSGRSPLPWYTFIQSKLFCVILAAIVALIFLSLTVLAAPAAPAGENIWTKAKAIMQDVYSQIILISTIAAVVTAAVALLLMNFSKNSRTVDESRAWLKRIIISWAILNGLGFIMAYVTPFFAGGEWTG